jgi:hypothetical protein
MKDTESRSRAAKKGEDADGIVSCISSWDV